METGMRHRLTSIRSFSMPDCLTNSTQILSFNYSNSRTIRGVELPHAVTGLIALLNDRQDETQSNGIEWVPKLSDSNFLSGVKGTDPGDFPTIVCPQILIAHQSKLC